MNVCIITPGQPSNNPRFVKEADALSEAGHSVHAICSDCGLWPSRMDAGLMASRTWTWEYAGGPASASPWRQTMTRVRHSLGRRLLGQHAPATVERWAAARAVPELARAVRRRPANLYIAHHPSVLPVAFEAAEKHGGIVGYDVEDIYAQMYPTGSTPSPTEGLIERIEARYLPQCAYVTAASDGFATAYEAKFGIARPTTVLNVFPLSDRPDEFRPTLPAPAPLRLYWFSQVIGRGRGVEDVVRALGSLGDCRFELHVRGNWMAGYRRELLSLAQRVGFDERNFVDHPPAEPAEMVRLAAAFDVGLCIEQPSDHSRPLGITNKTFVSLLAGNALISTNMPGQRPVLNTIGAAVRAYEPGDVGALAKHLKAWHDDRGQLDESRRSAWAWAERRYNWNLEKETFLSVVDAALHGRSSGARRNCA